MFMKRLAYHILGRSNELQIPITNFQINKLVYFTVVYALKEKLISKDHMAMLYQYPNNHFVATELGTLVPNLLDWEFTKFGAYYIVAPEVQSFRDLEPLNPIIDKLLNQIETDYIESSFKAPIYKNKPKTNNFEIPYQLEDLFNHAKII